MPFTYHDIVTALLVGEDSVYTCLPAFAPRTPIRAALSPDLHPGGVYILSSMYRAKSIIDDIDEALSIFSRSGQADNQTRDISFFFSLLYLHNYRTGGIRLYQQSSEQLPVQQIVPRGKDCTSDQTHPWLSIPILFRPQ